jgi:hypothetical protein
LHSKNDNIISLKDAEKATFRASATTKVKRLFFQRYLAVEIKKEKLY